jgi:hypothetical protein
MPLASSGSHGIDVADDVDSAVGSTNAIDDAFDAAELASILFPPL